MSALAYKTFGLIKSRATYINGHSNRLISTTCALNAQPPKKKRRIDPAVFRVRIEKKITRVEREIARIEKQPRVKIPILEYDTPKSEQREIKTRPKHTMAEYGLDEAALRGASRLWTFYRQIQSRMQRASIIKLERAQSTALKHLEKLDKELYENTVAVDDITLIPYRSNHMRKETAPNANYTPPDGYVKDITKEWSYS